MVWEYRGGSTAFNTRTTHDISITSGYSRLRVSLLARMTIKGLDSTIKMLEQLGEITQETAEYAVYEGASILADDVRKRLEGNLIGSKHTTGDLLDSLGITPIKMDENGVVNAKIGFSGYDRKGTPNLLKARAMESGTSRQRKKPFFRPAVNYNRKKIQEKMGRIVYNAFDKVTKE